MKQCFWTSGQGGGAHINAVKFKSKKSLLFLLSRLFFSSPLPFFFKQWPIFPEPWQLHQFVLLNGLKFQRHSDTHLAKKVQEALFIHLSSQLPTFLIWLYLRLHELSFFFFFAKEAHGTYKPFFEYSHFLLTFFFLYTSLKCLCLSLSF